MSHDHDEDDTTTTRKLVYTFGAFGVLCVFLIVLANMIG